MRALIGACSARSASVIRNRALPALYPLRTEGQRGRRPAGADVDLRKHSVRVLHGKGDKATTRGFHPSCDDALARWIDTRKALGIRGGTLFCALAGGAVSGQYVRNAVHPPHAGVPSLSPPTRPTSLPTRLRGSRATGGTG